MGKFEWIKKPWNNHPVFKWAIILSAIAIVVAPFVLREVDKIVFNDPNAPLVWDGTWIFGGMIVLLVGGSWVFRNNE